MSGVYMFSGTVGDAYIAMCKLSSLGRPYQLRRLSRHAGSDDTISKLTRLFPDCRYVTPYIHFDTIDEMRAYAFRHCGEYVNIFFDGNGRGNEPDDPPGIGFLTGSGPRLSSSIETFRDMERHIIIHLHAGSRPESPRALNAHWVRDLCKEVCPCTYEVILTGTGECYSQAELKQLPGEKIGVSNIVGKDTFDQWVELLTTAKLAVLPEGLPAFLALSHGVPTIVFFRDPTAILRMPYEWRRLATFIRVGGREERWAPMDVGLLAESIKAMVAPDELEDTWMG